MVDEQPGSPELPPYIYLCSPGTVLAEDGQIDRDATTNALNELAESGWMIVASGIVSTPNGLETVLYWAMETSHLAKEIETVEEKCGVCGHRDGNLCTKFGYSVGADDSPLEEGCFRPLE